MGKHKGPKTKETKKDKRAKKAPTTAEEEAEIAAQVREIEERLSDISNEMNKIDAKTKRYNIEAKRAELTNRELDRLPDDSHVYRQIGRMWVQTKKTVLVTNMKGMDALKTVEAQQMRQMRMKLEERARSEADQLKELIGVDKFKDLFGKAQKADPSQTLADMDGNKDDEMKPLFGKAAKKKAMGSMAAIAEAAEGEQAEPEPA